ncbi:hypothetical protein ACLBWZ_17345 [Brucellaceae bacterium C25G]
MVYEAGLYQRDGQKKKKRAILEIFGEIVRNNGQNYKAALNGVLQVCDETGRIQVIIGDDASKKQPFNWRDNFTLINQPNEQDFEWADARNQRRRQKYAERQKAA